MLTDSDAKLATIVAKELAFINRALQIMSRTKKQCRHREVTRIQDNDSESGSDNDIEALLHTVSDSDCDSDSDRDSNYDIMSRYFGALCAFIDVDMSDVHAMTYLDQPVTDVSIARQRTSKETVIMCILTAFKKHGACRVVERLHDMSSRVWTRMAYMAYCDNRPIHRTRQSLDRLSSPCI